MDPPIGSRPTFEIDASRVTRPPPVAAAVRKLGTSRTRCAPSASSLSKVICKWYSRRSTRLQSSHFFLENLGVTGHTRRALFCPGDLLHLHPAVQCPSASDVSVPVGPFVSAGPALGFVLQCPLGDGCGLLCSLELPRLADFGTSASRHFGASAFRHPSRSISIRTANGQRLKFFRAVVPKLRSRAGEGQSDAPPVSALQPSACQHSMR